MYTTECHSLKCSLFRLIWAKGLLKINHDNILCSAQNLQTRYFLSSPLRRMAQRKAFPRTARRGFTEADFISSARTCQHAREANLLFYFYALTGNSHFFFHHKKPENNVSGCGRGCKQQEESRSQEPISSVWSRAAGWRNDHAECMLTFSMIIIRIINRRQLNKSKKWSHNLFIFCLKL